MVFLLPLCPFQSTRPIRGVTHKALVGHQVAADISIHAPHTGRDAKDNGTVIEPELFQSTRPIRGATARQAQGVYLEKYFNPRAPYGARLSVLESHRQVCVYFNPRAPYGARRPLRQSKFVVLRISIHAPHTGRDIHFSRFTREGDISIHAPHTGRDNAVSGNTKISITISIHAPHTGRDHCCR